MKKTVFALILFALAGSLHGQMLEVTSSGVGIGTSTPSQLLEISSASSNAWEVLRRPGTSNVALLEFMTSSTPDWGLGTINNSTSDFNLFNYGTSSSAVTVLKSNGNVGIGTASPVTKLDVSGGLATAGAVQVNAEYINVRSGHPYVELQDTSGGGTYASMQSINGYLRIYVGGEWLVVKSNGNVGIGTSTPAYKLEVNGSVRATSFVSNSTTYADFVFKPSYQLRSLADVETAIQRDGHLPDIPSEAEAKAHGIDLAKQQAKLLQKVEELTLYAIEQNKRIEAMQGEISRLKTGSQFQR